MAGREPACWCCSAARELDWSGLMEDMNARDVAILMMAAGQLTNGELSRHWGVSRARVSHLKTEFGRQVMLPGDGALADAVAELGWLRGSMRAALERSACRHARQACRAAATKTDILLTYGTAEA